ncbi:MAG: stage III sporulation protein AD [Clostridia bacterium]|nr:stage III sporulation protein AD [Oscillospiraceae bacterium]MBR4892465.1 stage III sporulation protein AD [Clostridia bacterium]
MNILIKVIMVGVISVFLSSIIKKQHPEYALAINVGASVIILIFLSDFFTLVFDNINSIMEKSGINPDYIVTILKIIGIAYLSEYTSALFYDANESAMGKKVELAGKIIIFIITLPVINSLSELIVSIF